MMDPSLFAADLGAVWWLLVRISLIVGAVLGLALVCGAGLGWLQRRAEIRRTQALLAQRRAWQVDQHVPIRHARLARQQAAAKGIAWHDDQSGR